LRSLTSTLISFAFERERVTIGEKSRFLVLLAYKSGERERI
jgi:hypothetical protein